MLKIEFELLYGSTCLFCGAEAKEYFFSGSYQSYRECRCEAKKQYIDAAQKLRSTVVVAESRRAYLEAKDQAASAARSAEAERQRAAMLEQAMADSIARSTKQDDPQKG